jgi:hypothetical protein
VAQEGTFTAAFGLATLFFVPASPKDIKLLTEEERETYCRDLSDDWSGDADTYGTYQEVFSWSEVASAFLDAPHVLMMFVALFFDGTMVRPRSIVPYVVTINDQSFTTRYLLLPTCIHSRHSLHFPSHADFLFDAQYAHYCQCSRTFTQQHAIADSAFVLTTKGRTYLTHHY